MCSRILDIQLEGLQSTIDFNISVYWGNISRSQVKYSHILRTPRESEI
jgi:hypothetical protein